MRFARIMAVAALAAALPGVHAMADTVPPLAPGKAAGMHQAQMAGALLVPAGLTGAAMAALVVAASDTGGMPGIAGIAANPTFTTVTTTSTSGTN